MNSKEFDPKTLSGRNRRLLYEWCKMEHCSDPCIRWQVLKANTMGLPECYLIDYHIRSFCGVSNLDCLNETGVINEPLFADCFQMLVELPLSYPCVDGAPRLQFLTKDIDGNPLSHPWHPNIRFFGNFAGRVCINMADTYTSLLWGVERVASYLRYETYHALLEPPYPEDLQVAAWVIRQGEPKGWVEGLKSLCY